MSSQAKYYISWPTLKIAAAFALSDTIPELKEKPFDTAQKFLGKYKNSLARAVKAHLKQPEFFDRVLLSVNKDPELYPEATFLRGQWNQFSAFIDVDLLRECLEKEERAFPGDSISEVSRRAFAKVLDNPDKTYLCPEEQLRSVIEDDVILPGSRWSVRPRYMEVYDRPVQPDLPVLGSNAKEWISLDDIFQSYRYSFLACLDKVCGNTGPYNFEEEMGETVIHTLDQRTRELRKLEQSLKDRPIMQLCSAYGITWDLFLGAIQATLDGENPGVMQYVASAKQLASLATKREALGFNTFLRTDPKSHITRGFGMKALRVLEETHIVRTENPWIPTMMYYLAVAITDVPGRTKKVELGLNRKTMVQIIETGRPGGKPHYRHRKPVSPVKDLAPL